jgi:hypothetical protein
MSVIIDAPQISAVRIRKMVTLTVNIDEQYPSGTTVIPITVDLTSHGFVKAPSLSMVQGTNYFNGGVTTITATSMTVSLRNLSGGTHSGSVKVLLIETY